MLSQVRYSKENNTDFHKELQKRVNSYFKENNISKHADANMVAKTVFMILLYFVPFVLLLTVLDNVWLIMLMWILMGFGLAGIGLSIMHDANHGAYSQNQRVNQMLGNLLNVIGGSDVNWRVQHNVLHHTYTNVDGLDEDLDPGALMRFSPRQPRRKVHRFQFLYAWFLYGLMTIMWVTVKDYIQHRRYQKYGLLKSQGKSEGRIFAKLLVSKIIYLSLTIGLPIMFSPVSWWLTLIFFFMMHFIGGLTLGLIFQPAHVVPSSDFNEPDEDGVIANDWAVSQLLNTANFAPKARIFSWYVGGLNYQIEHHLFPTVCHVHYRKISPIVRATAEEYNLPYHSYNTFRKAVAEHAKMLYILGKKPAVKKAA